MAARSRTRIAMETDASPAALSPLSLIQARILGCLIEKEATTPEAYPLTANAVVLACNQKSNREPLMELEAGEVGHALREMENLGLIKSVHGARAQRYEHRFSHMYSVTLRQQALLCVMLLRGPQTAAELFSRSERLGAAPDLDDVRQRLDRLSQRSPALVVNIGRGSGQREDRYMHLLGGPVDAELLIQNIKATSPGSERGGLEARVEALEADLAALRAQLAELRNPAA